jgi:uncharacterized membrane protein
MKKPAIIIALSILFFCSSAAADDTISYYGVEAEIRDDFSVYNKLTFVFSEPLASFSYRIDRRLYNLRASGTFETEKCSAKNEGVDSVIYCTMTGLPENAKIVLEFDTKDDIKRAMNNNMFDTSYPVERRTERISMFLKLPFNGVLSDGSEANQSFFPRDGQVITDGRHIIVYWDRENVSAGKVMKFSAMYENAPNGGAQNVIIMLLMAVVAVAMVAMLYIAKKRAGPKSINVIAPMLTGDERRVIDIVAGNGGTVIQRVIVRETDFSKAKVSRIVNGLKNRRVLDIEPRGRTNKIILRIKEEGKPDDSNETGKAPPAAQ